jgi:hypothetical protein
MKKSPGFPSMINPENNELAGYIISHWKIWEPWVKNTTHLGPLNCFENVVYGILRTALKTTKVCPCSFLITTQQHRYSHPM